ncbi:hypothetical protein F3Y22_tig00110332pilonHSYRG00335 [Hibiscus syriacus]|uniref:Protein kinase domain-containing protein n=1 Tax=Hibiscus syriacus TaxID=106335 RepID=A0A6A3AWN5_HIBSY|nr:hypothetical protein F3Y22_tig00110332pilonHSYRG00335 [Hibiscus syriacus]
MAKKKYPVGAEFYTLHEEIGQGVSATVRRAVCLPLDEVVAIKILDFEHVIKVDPQKIQAIVRKARWWPMHPINLNLNSLLLLSSLCGKLQLKDIERDPVPDQLKDYNRIKAKLRGIVDMPRVEGTYVLRNIWTELPMSFETYGQYTYVLRNIWTKLPMSFETYGQYTYVLRNIWTELPMSFETYGQYTYVLRNIWTVHLGFEKSNEQCGARQVSSPYQMSDQKRGE